MSMPPLLSLAPTPQTIEAVHRDIALANSYRMELIRTLLAIAAALFAFTVTFGPTLKQIEWKSAMWFGWGGLAISMVGGMIHLLGWDHFYKSYLDVDWRRRLEANQEAVKKSGKSARKIINFWRRLGMFAQFGGFVIGVVGIGLFAGANLENAVTKGELPPPVTEGKPATVTPDGATKNDAGKSAVPAIATASEVTPKAQK